MKTKIALAFILLASQINCFSQANIKDENKVYHPGIGIYPVGFYELGHNIKWNFLLSKRNHDFYIGFSTHINHDFERWSNTGYAFRGNGVARKTAHFFHPNIGYTKYIQFTKNYPVFFIINPDFQFGKTYLDSKWYTYNPQYNSNSELNDGYDRILNNAILDKGNFKYWQLSLNLGFKIEISNRVQLNSKAGLGIAHLHKDFTNDAFASMNGYEFPVVYSVGINYIFK